MTTTVRIRLLWLKQAQFAGTLIAGELGLARRNGIEIVCEPADFSQGPIAAVLTGAADMCVASPAHLLESADPAALRWILGIQQDSPLVYPVRRSSGIDTLADLKGKSIAVWPGGEDLEIRWMLQGAGLGDADVTRVPSPDTVAPFIAGEVASAQMTTYHELHLAEDAIGADNLRLFRASDTGQALLKDGLIATARMTEEAPEVVQAVVDAVLEGWTIAFTDPERAVAICSAVRPDMPAEEHAAQLADIRRLSLTGATLREGLGVPDPTHLARAAEAIATTERRSVPTTGIADRRFFDASPPRFRRSDWP